MHNKRGKWAKCHYIWNRKWKFCYKLTVLSYRTCAAYDSFAYKKPRYISGQHKYKPRISADCSRPSYTYCKCKPQYKKCKRRGPITAPLYFFIRSLTASTHIFFNCPLCSDSISVNPDKILIIKFSPNILYQEYFIIFYHESQVPCFLLLLYPLQLFEKSWAKTFMPYFIDLIFLFKNSQS